MSDTKKIIYDFGANNGDDIPYYLLKADLVIAVEANPVLTDIIKNKFSKEIEEGRLIVENCALTIDPPQASIPFYVCDNHVQSQLNKPEERMMQRFKEISIESKNVIDLIKHHGEPYYIKIDIEHYDQYVLKELFLNNICPPYISCEAHIPDIFCIMVALGNYKAFKFVKGGDIDKLYKDLKVTVDDNTVVEYSFPHHAAGPFGEDLGGKWRDTNEMFNDLSGNFGWIDIHATNIHST